MSKFTPDWTALAQQFPLRLVEAVRNRISRDEPFTVSVQELRAQVACQEQQATELLSKLCPPFARESALRCGNCNKPLTQEEAQSDYCPHCEKQYNEHGVLIDELFAYDAPRSRDVAWVLALHGMNTRGAWQEDFAWRVSTAYGRSVPVAIYKYGLVQPGAIWTPSLRRKVKRVTERIKKLKGDTEVSGFGDVPDVIAHSLGTWLLGHALLWDPSLVVGRVVLAGSILRPDFDWAALIANGQVEAVLNHYGDSDFWAGVAHYVIPDSGPSGRRGFDANESIVQVCAKSFGHSDFFLEANLSNVFKDIWQPFLVSPLSGLPFTGKPEKMWHRAWWPLRGTILPVVLLGMYCAMLSLALVCLILGIWQGLHWL